MSVFLSFIFLAMAVHVSSQPTNLPLRRSIAAFGVLRIPCTTRVRPEAAFRMSLKTALSKPKLTLSPSVSPGLEPVQTKMLSRELRETAGAGCVAVLESELQVVSAEQASAKGGFPGPLPVICLPSDRQALTPERLDQMVGAGADAVLLRSQESSLGIALPISQIEAQAARETGLCPVFQLDLDPSLGWTEADVHGLLQQVVEECGDVVVLVTLGNSGSVSFPSMPKQLKGKLWLMGGVLGGDVGMAKQLMDQAGYAGALLHSNCVQGVTGSALCTAWVGLVSALKKAKSSSFNAAGLGVGMASKMSDNSLQQGWEDLRKNAVESGALGGEEHVDLGAAEDGNYKGF